MNPIGKRLYVQLTALLLAAHFLGRPEAMPLAVALNAVQCVHAVAVRRGLAHLEAQVRIAFLGLLLLGLLPGASPLHAVQFAGVNAMLVAGYCPLARLLVLMPWNAGAAPSLGLVRRVLLAPPSDAPIVAVLAQSKTERDLRTREP